MNILLNILIEFWNVITAMSPYLLLGFFVAGILSVLISQEMVEKHIGEETILSVINLKTEKTIIKDIPSICRSVNELGYSCISKQ